MIPTSSRGRTASIESDPSDGSEVSTNPQTMAIREYRTSDDSAIARLNERFRAAGTTHVQYAGSSNDSVTARAHRERLFVVTDGDEIRGGAFLREVPIAIGDDVTTIGWVKYPLAESQIDRAFSGVPAALLLQLLREQPQLAALGMGGHAGAFAQLLSRLRWEGSTIRTFICPLRPHVVATALPHLKRTPSLRRFARIFHASGLAHFASAVAPSLVRARNRTLLRSSMLVPVDAFLTGFDALWGEARAAYPAIGVRDTSAAGWRFPPSAPGMQRFEVRRGGALIGWFVLQVVNLREVGDASPYGPLKLGVLHDCLAIPSDAATVSAWALDVLLARGADLALANHSHSAWHDAMRRVGFLTGPESFAYYRAPATKRTFALHGVDPTKCRRRSA